MLEMREIKKTYGELTALNNISLTLEEGVYALLGPNGAGKSTLMSIITGNCRADSGVVLWNDKEIKKLGRAYRSILGYAPQQQGLYDTFTGRRFLCYMAALKELPGKCLETEAEKAAAYVNLTDKLDMPIGSYSGGMKQRLLVAQAVMGNPELIILDEPTAGLDPKERVRIRERIQALSEGRVILVATHVVSDIETIAREVIVLKQGELIAQGEVGSLCEQYHEADLEAVYMHLFGRGGDADGGADY